MKARMFTLLSFVIVVTLLVPGRMKSTVAQSGPLAPLDQIPPGDVEVLAPQSNGLADNVVNAIVVDGAGHMWFGIGDGLFADVTAVGSGDSADDPTIVRTRFIEPNFDLLGGANDSPVADVLELNLFEDVAFTAILDRAKSNPSGSLSWIGHLEGVEYGSVILVVKDGVMVGSVKMPGALYQVRYVGDGVHAIHEMDSAAFPPELEPMSAAASEDALVEALNAPMADDGSTIDVLVVYTPAARADVGGTTAMENLIDQAIAETNTSYINSNVTQRVNLVHTEEVPYDETGFDWPTTLGHLRTHGDGYFDNVTQSGTGLRDTYCADEVVLIVEDNAYCGLAYLMDPVSSSFESYAFAMVCWECATGYYQFEHEMGHNMGLRHDWYVDDSVTPYTYAHGYVNTPDQWRTIMAYNSDCADQGFNCTRLQYWSNPDVTYGGDPMGVSEGISTSCSEGVPNPNCDADNHKTLDNTAYTVSNFRESSGCVPDTTPPATITDLAASTSDKPGEIDLAWTAPGDDGNTGTAMTYTVRYYDTVIVPGFGWLLATDVSDEPLPLAASTQQSMTVSGLIPGQTYYFAIKTQDEASNTSGLSNSPSAMAREEPPWALMFYMDGDNNLDDNYVAAFNQLESAADNSNANIIVAWDRFADGNSAYYEVQHDTDLAETNPAADYTDDVNRWPQNELGMNESATLSDFIQWARTHYPAQHYALIISNHGTGLGGLAIDAGSGSDWLTVTEWSTALATATSDGTDKIDVVFADACLMAMIEDAFQIRNYTDYYVASENLSWIPVSSTSGPYDDYISSIEVTTSPRDLAVALVDRYRNWIDAGSPFGYTMSAVDLAELNGVVSATNALASELNSQMSTYASQISQARMDVQKFDSNNSRTLTQADVYVDLHDFANEIKARISDTTIQDATDGVMDAIQSCVLAEAHRDGVLRLGESVQTLDGSRGVSIFFPPNASSFYNSTNYDFAVGATWPGSQSSLIRTQAGEVEWGPMLVTYFNETQPGGPDTPEPPPLVSPATPEVGNISKSITPTGQVNYGDELIYTLVISAAPGMQLGLYDPLTDTTFLRFVQPVEGITHTNRVITGTLTVTPTNQITVSFAVKVGVPGTLGWTVDVTNRACVYPVGETLGGCVWSNAVTNSASRPYSVSIEKSVLPQGQVDYGDELTYTLVISAAPGMQLGLYDPLEDTTFVRFVERPSSVTHVDTTNGTLYLGGVITGTVTVTPSNQITVSFVTQVDAPGTVGWTITATNCACVYPLDGTLDNCVWSEEATNLAFHPHSIYLPLVLRNY
ncbi:MAG: hypothetical protein GY832_28120 [Chloroflexi bacterium]|nr:hypothetical protein [Chloroflexota bacterium]